MLNLAPGDHLKIWRNIVWPTINQSTVSSSLVSLQLTSAHIKMSVLTSDPSDPSEDTLDTTDMASTVVPASVKAAAEVTTNLNSSTAAGEGQQDDIWVTVASKKKVVRGSQLVNFDSQSSSGETSLTLSTIRCEPHIDFNVQGVPRLEDTLFQSIEEYNEHYKAALIKNGFKVRFVSVYRPSDNKRGSTSLRIGSFVSEKEKLMDTAKWPSNCRICLWDYNLLAKKTSYQFNSLKNRV